MFRAFAAAGVDVGAFGEYDARQLVVSRKGRRSRAHRTGLTTTSRRVWHGPITRSPGCSTPLDASRYFEWNGDRRPGALCALMRIKAGASNPASEQARLAVRFRGVVSHAGH